jgi:hypothetical protein
MDDSAALLHWPVRSQPQPSHRIRHRSPPCEFFDQSLHRTRAASYYSHGIAPPPQFRQPLMHVRQNLQPFRTVQFGYHMSKGEFDVIRTHRLRYIQPRVFTGDSFEIMFMGEWRLLYQLVKRIARGNIQRPMNIDQSAVEIKKIALNSRPKLSLRRIAGRAQSTRKTPKKLRQACHRASLNSSLHLFCRPACKRGESASYK